MRLTKFYIIGALAFMAVAVFAGCNKKEDTIAKIYVRDSGNQAVSGAQVVVYGQSTTSQPTSVTLFDTTTTNSSGEAVFNFNDVYQLGQAGVAVLNIDVTADGLAGQGIIKVEQETTSEETVFVQ
ncbi:MAG: hypothetical protein QNK23_01745 [Crocinitomicaceae bacterium]|nr:hypothetical protein [Crocinitomicaceae bacterium]